eukprot:4530930-Prymnesium_polylepis.1
MCIRDSPAAPRPPTGGGGGVGGAHDAVDPLAAIHKVHGAAAPSGMRASQDPFLCASKACVRADASRCGRIDAATMLQLCGRYAIKVPPDMVEAARKKGMCSYTIFIDKLREINGAA